MFLKLGIIIVTYNGERWLNKCLESVSNCSTKVELIIVDNNSNDKTKNIIEKYNNSTNIFLDENVGFGRANNIALSYTLKENFDYVFLLNQDAYLQPNTIEKLVEIFVENLDYGIVSPIHLNGKATVLDANFTNYAKVNGDLDAAILANKFTQSIYDVPFVNAAGWLLSTKLFKSIGGFDPIFFHYGEDLNFCQRALYHGFKIGIVPSASILHDRENRVQKTKLTISDTLKVAERKYKAIWADINTDDISVQVSYEKRKMLKGVFKALLRLKIRQARIFLAEYFLIIRILPEINRSRKKNISIGLHYLNVS